MLKLADVLLWGGSVAFVSGCAWYDWRAGLVVGGLCGIVAGTLLALDRRANYARKRNP
jgi:hypothetical protein